MIRKARNRDALLEGRRILVVEAMCAMSMRHLYSGAARRPDRDRPQRRGSAGEAQPVAGAAGPAHRSVLMDVMMPVMDGLTATRMIRMNAGLQELPVITLTAKAMPDDQQRCIEAGANDYMAKPLDVEKLLSARSRMDAAMTETTETTETMKVEDIEIRLLLEASIIAITTTSAAMPCPRSAGGCARRASSWGSPPSRPCRRPRCTIRPAAASPRLPDRAGQRNVSRPRLSAPSAKRSCRICAPTRR